jgi:hypothetical protein
MHKWVGKLLRAGTNIGIPDGLSTKADRIQKEYYLAYAAIGTTKLLGCLLVFSLTMPQPSSASDVTVSDSIRIKSNLK